MSDAGVMSETDGTAAEAGPRYVMVNRFHSGYHHSTQKNGGTLLDTHTGINLSWFEEPYHENVPHKPFGLELPAVWTVRGPRQVFEFKTTRGKVHTFSWDAIDDWQGDTTFAHRNVGSSLAWANAKLQEGTLIAIYKRVLACDGDAFHGLMATLEADGPDIIVDEVSSV